jgi:hypothetical protein
MRKKVKLILNWILKLFGASCRNASPEWLKQKNKTGSTESRNASAKVIRFIRCHSLTESQMRELFEIELEYEVTKAKANHDYPHVKDVLREEINKAKAEKVLRINEVIGSDLAKKYSSNKLKKSKK